MARSSRRSLLLVITLILACGFLGAVFAQRTGVNASTSDSEIRDNLRQFTQVYSLIEQNYAEPVKADKVIYNGAIPGMLRVLDPHSNFFDPSSMPCCERISAASTTVSGCRWVHAIIRSS